MRRGPALAVGIALLVLAPAAHAAPSAYVTIGDDNAAGIAQYSIGAGGVLAPMSPFLAGPPNSLTGIVLSPDGRSAYVAQSFSNAGSGPTTPLKAVLQFDVNPTTGALTPKAPPSAATAGDAPASVAVGPSGRSLYVTSSLANNISQFDVNPTTGALTPKAAASVAAGDTPVSIAVTPNGRNAYVANFNDDTLSQYTIDPASGALTPLGSPVSAPGQPTAVTVTPDGRTLYAPTQPGVLQFDIDPATGLLTPKSDPIETTSIPSLITVSPNGKSAYVDLPNTNQLLQYDVSASDGTLSPKTPPSASVGTNPFPALANVGVTPDSSRAYVLSGLSSVYGFNADASGALTPQSPASVAAGAAQSNIAITPDVPVASFSASASGLTASFNASGSSDVGGSITGYAWNFGDGATGSGAQVSHAYGAAGTYTATLTVTSATGCTLGSLVYLSRMAACSGAGAQASQAVSVAASSSSSPSTTAPSGTPTFPTIAVSPGRARTGIRSRTLVVVGVPPNARTQVALRCGASGASRCIGRLALSVDATAAAARRLRAGSARFAIRASQARRVTVRIGRRAFRALARRGRLAGRVTVTTRESGGRRPVRTRRTVVLRLDRGRG